MDQVEEVKRKTDIVGVVGQYVALKKIGRHHKGLCPFHTEKTPSFMVNEELGLYKCFGCGAGGDVLKFVMEVEGIDFRDALEKLADKVGVKLVSLKPDRFAEEKQKLFDLLDLTARYYHWLLTEGKSGEAARKYLKDRKVNDKLIETFKIGYSMEGWDNLINYLVKKKGFELGLLEKAGLVSKRSSGGYYDKFRGRLMFPLQNSGGKVVGFSARVMPGENKENEPKYLNSPETEVYHKGSMLYGFYQAKPAIREQKRVVLVEGQMDMISSYGAGVGETVAVGGTALTENQIEMLARLTKNIYLSLDADEAGIAAIKRAVELAEKRGLEIRVVQIEGGKDPDEIAKNNPSLWKKMVDEAVDVYEFVMKKAFQKYDAKTVEGIKKITEEVMPFLSKIENQVVKEVWIKKLAERLSVEPSVIKTELGRGESRQPVEVFNPKTKNEEVKKVDKLARGLIGGLLTNLDGREVVRPWAGVMGLQGALGKALEYVLSAKEKEVGVIVESAPAELKEILSESYLAEGDLAPDDKAIINLVVPLVRETLREKRKQLTEELRKMGGDEAKEEQILKEMSNLDKEESKILLLLG